MLRIVKSLLLVSALITGVSAAEKLSQKQIDEIEDLEFLDKAQLKVTDAYDVGSLYFLNVNVQGKADKFFLTKDKKYLIAGSVMSTKDGEILNFPVDMSKVLGNESFVYGTGSEELVLFIDPECPYCKKFESYLPQIKDKVKIKFMFFPLSFHENARALSIYVMNQKTDEEKAKALFSATKDTKAFVNRKIDAKTQEKLYAQLDKQIKIGEELGVRGTPALFDLKGNKVSWINLLEKHGVQVK